MPRTYLLEQVDDAAIVQYYADGFAALPLKQKMLCWHLYNAAIAGRDIYYDQRYQHALDMRDLLEGILTRHPDALRDSGAPVITEIRRYAKLFWINSGPHSNITARKFVLTCTPAELAEAARVAEQHGARFRGAEESLEALLSRLRAPFFDPDFDPMVTCKTPDGDGDILSSSANNLYEGVIMADLEGFEERYALNSRLVRTPDGLVEEVYRIGGRYSAHIERIVEHLRSALPLAEPPMRRGLEALIRFYESGEEADRVAYDIAWVQDTDSPIDTVNGFIEVYLDARGVKGAWEGIVSYINVEKTDGLRRLADAAAWFEARMPIDPRWRREEVVGVTARAIDVIVETGEAGPMTAIGINLPNDQAIRERYGSKSVSLANINEAYEKSQMPSFRREFCWSPEELGRAERWGAVASEVTTAIHEVIGHGSGRVADHLEGQPQLALKEQYSAIEEARADLVALYFIPDPKTAEVGLLPAESQEEIVITEYEAYARTALVQLRRMREGTIIEEDHMRNRQMIVRWLMDHTSAIELRVREGKTYYVLTDAEAFRVGVGHLLGEVQRIKSEGDYEGARALFTAYGVHFDPALRDEIVARVDRLNLPSYTGFVQPKLEPVVDESGAITDVAISYPCSLEQQMLEYAGKI
jgi:dipeptidyl-peptidase-3